jgi:hypothetical protein
MRIGSAPHTYLQDGAIRGFCKLGQLLTEPWHGHALRQPHIVFNAAPRYFSGE